MAEERKRVMPVSHEELQAERVPLPMRDYCAHILIPLNRCRVETFYLPWKCHHERHEYERCQYVEYVHVDVGIGVVVDVGIGVVVDVGVGVGVVVDVGVGVVTDVSV
jgi:NADH dehydrogenase (ubiquinone) 1 beta subcomplex subunit 7